MVEHQRSSNIKHQLTLALFVRRSFVIKISEHEIHHRYAQRGEQENGNYFHRSVCLRCEGGDGV